MFQLGQTTPFKAVEQWSRQVVLKEDMRVCAAFLTDAARAFIAISIYIYIYIDIYA
jgi:hypothetical protein